MEILEFGDRNKQKIILIHGFQCPYQIWEEYIEHYKNNFHIIIPVMPGHNPKMREDLSPFYRLPKNLRTIIFPTMVKMCMPFMVCLWVVF